MYVYVISLCLGDVTITDITKTSATVLWTIPFVSAQQQYTVFYGNLEDSVNISAGSVSGNPDTTLLNQNYSASITGLDQASTYYVQVVSEFDRFTLYSDLIVFTTIEIGK